MSIQALKSDIFHAPAEILIHQANCFCRMRSGVAKAITDKFPEVAFSDAATKEGDMDKLGRVGPVILTDSRGTNFKRVLNCYSQYRYGREDRKTNYEAYYVCLTKVEQYARTLGMNVAAPYKMGCSLAGGDWNVCYSMFVSVFDKSPVTCYICEHPDSGVSQKTATQN